MNFHDFDWPSLQKDFNSKENLQHRIVYTKTFSSSEKDLIKLQWAEKMIETQKHIVFFDFLQSLKPSILNVVKKPFVKAKKNTVVQASHPPLEALMVKGKDDTVVIASPFKTTKNDPAHSETRKIIEQTNFVNQSMNIGQQLDRMEEKIDHTKNIEKPFQKSLAIKEVEKPLIYLPKERKGTGLKNNSQKNLERIEEMLLEISLRKTSHSPEVSSSTINNACVISHGKGNETFIDEAKSFESDPEDSNSSATSDIKILEENFGQIDVSPKLQIIFKTNPINLIKN